MGSSDPSIPLPLLGAAVAAGGRDHASLARLRSAPTRVGIPHSQLAPSRRSALGDMTTTGGSIHPVLPIIPLSLRPVHVVHLLARTGALVAARLTQAEESDRRRWKERPADILYIALRIERLA